MNTTLSDIVDYVMADRGETSTHKRLQYMHFAIRGLKKLQMDTLKSIKAVQLTMQSNRVVNIPDDSIGVIKVGILCGECIHTIVMKEGLALWQDKDNCGVPISNNECDNASDSLYSYLLNGGYPNQWGYNFSQTGQNLGRMFGRGGRNSEGYYRYNRELNQLWFSHEVTDTTIYMEYISNGLSPDGNTTIPVIAEESLLAWIHYQIAWNTSTMPQYEKKDKMDMFGNELRLLRARLNKFNKQEYLYNSRKNYKLSPKN